MSHENCGDATIYGARLSRRGFLAAGGALVVYVGLAPRDALSQAPAPSHSLDPTRSSSWIEIRADNTVQFRTGKCDFGQSSIYVAYPQIVAEELGVPLEAITSVVSGDTDRTPDGGGTFGQGRNDGGGHRVGSLGWGGFFRLAGAASCFILRISYALRKRRGFCLG